VAFILISRVKSLTRSGPASRLDPFFKTGCLLQAVTRLNAVLELPQKGKLFPNDMLKLDRVFAHQGCLLTLQGGLDQPQAVQARLYGRGECLYELRTIHVLLRFAQAGLEGQHLVGDARRLNFV